MILWPNIDDLAVFAIETRWQTDTESGGSRYAARRVWPGEQWQTVATDYALGAGVEQYRRAAEQLAGGPVVLIGETDTGPLFLHDTGESQ